MRYGIFSDIHANLEALEAVIAAYKKESIDEYLCVGDLVGYGADPGPCVEKVEKIVQITVAGNHDWASVGLFSDTFFNPVAKEAIEWTKGKLNRKSAHFLESLRLVYENKDLTLVHGTLEGPENFDYMIDSFTAASTFRTLGTPICFVGHLHCCGVFVQDKSGRIKYGESGWLELNRGCRYIVNVGSVGQPRDGNPRAAYCVYDTSKKEVEIKRVDYDFSSARKRIIQAGLPGFLGERILVGR